MKPHGYSSCFIKYALNSSAIRLIMAAAALSYIPSNAIAASLVLRCFVTDYMEGGNPVIILKIDTSRPSLQNITDEPLRIWIPRNTKGIDDDSSTSKDGDCVLKRRSFVTVTDDNISAGWDWISENDCTTRSGKRLDIGQKSDDMALYNLDRLTGVLKYPFIHFQCQRWTGKLF